MSMVRMEQFGQERVIDYAEDMLREDISITMKILTCQKSRAEGSHCALDPTNLEIMVREDISRTMKILSCVQIQPEHS